MTGSEVLAIEYEMTGEDAVRAYRRMPRSRFRLLGGAFCLFLAVSGWEHNPWWFTLLLAVLAIEMWFAQDVIILSGIKWMFRSSSSIPIRIEFDELGVRTIGPHSKFGARSYWKRLSSVEDTDDAIRLTFDRGMSEVLIPHRALRDAEQHRQICDYIDEHARPTGAREVRQGR